VLLAQLVSTSAAVAATRSRKQKIETIAGCLREASPDELALVVRYLTGELRQRRTGVGWAALRDVPPPDALATLTVTDVDVAFAAAEAASGPGSVGRRRDAMAALFGRATAAEQVFLRQLAGGELRQGALAGVMTDAVASAFGVPLAKVRRAAMLRGDLSAVAEIARQDGSAGLDAIGLQVGRPIQPMLAQSSPTVDEAMTRLGDAVVEWKVDGVRVQVHRDGDDVAVFTRTLDDITARVPDIVERVLALPVRSVVLDGEAIALRPDGRPRPFQHTAARVATGSGNGTGNGEGEGAAAGEQHVLTPWFFDALHLDGTDLIDLPLEQRVGAIGPALPDGMWVPRRAVADADDAAAFFADAIAHGHEGVMVKAPASLYEAGRRGAGWIKVKPRHTLDLVVLAAEWGHGRRRGWLSNLHLGARDPDGGFVMLGKTFKGLTDELLRWQTEQLLARATDRDDFVVHVRPELVVEIAFDGVQTSPRYPGGVALRFARVIRYRDDKRADEADTIDTVRSFHPG
jgi:DNA ligase-1